MADRVVVDRVGLGIRTVIVDMDAERMGTEGLDCCVKVVDLVDLMSLLFRGDGE